MTPDNSNKKLFLLDAYALIYRSYFAFIRNPRFNSKGQNTSAILGFVNTLEQVLSAEKPDYIAVAFDMHGPTFRHEMFEAYKANREAMPEDIRTAVPYIRKVIEAYNIPILEMQGFEADDIIGTISKKASNEGFDTFMMTPDKDYAQLVNENTVMYKPAKGGEKAQIWGVDEVKENFLIENTEQVIDILGLMGDSADNIPGCPGIGPKTAMKLIGKYGSISNLYNNIEDLKGKQKQNLIENKEQVYLSRELVVINREVPIDISFDKMKKGESDKEALLELFNELEFRTLAAKISGGAKKSPNPVQGDLFSSPVESEEEASPSQLKNITTEEHQYFSVENEMQRASLRAELAVSKEFCFDTETTGLSPLTDELVCISFSKKNGEAYCVHLPEDRKEAEKIVQEFKLIFEDEKILKIGQNIKFDLLILAQYGLKVKGPIFDTMIAHYLIQPEIRHNLDYLSELYLNYKKVPTEQLIGKKGKNQKTMRQVEPQEIVDYACEDADITFQLKAPLAKELEESELYKLFNEIEMPLLSVLLEMELNGVKIDSNSLNNSAQALSNEIDQLEKDIQELAGEEFNVSSPKQLGPILFEKLKIQENAKKTKTKQYSTNEETLQRLTDKHPIVNKILEFRGLRKLLSTYIEALPKLVNEKTGMIHTSYNQAVAATGRLSSVNPNLQNIPIRDEKGKEIRKAFIPAHKGNVFLSADYSQIELRIMAALSKDPAMVEAFAQEVDIHSRTAAKIFKVEESEVSSDMRRKAKTANFGIIYGISAFGLSQRLNISRKEAKEIIDGYFEAFPKVKEFMDFSIEEARKTGFVKTMLGRKRYLKDINSANAVVRGIAERNAINAPIQGTAADIIKIAMIEIQNQIEQKGLKSKMILQVHDELNFDAFADEVEELSTIIKHSMENAVKLDVPLTVEIGKGKNWLEAH